MEQCRRPEDPAARAAGRSTRSGNLQHHVHEDLTFEQHAERRPDGGRDDLAWNLRKKCQRMSKTSMRNTRGGGADLSLQLRPTLIAASKLFRGVAQRFEFPYFQFCLRTIVGPGTPLQVLIDGGPPGFQAAIDLGARETQEALLAKAFASTRPFSWQSALRSGDRVTSDLLSTWARLGMADGFTVPLHGPGGAVGVLSLASSRPLPAAVPQREQLFKDAHWDALEAFDQANTAIRAEFETDPRERPTSRQRQALALAARGYPLFAIAQQMGVQPSTARYLISRATEKLGVRSREEAIVRITAMDRLARDVYPSEIADQFVYFFTPAEQQASGLSAQSRPGGASRV